MKRKYSDAFKLEREKQYEDEIRELKARIKYLEGLASVKPYLKKTQTARSNI